MITRFEALKAVDDIFNYCEEIDNSLPEIERSGYEMLPDIHKIRKYIIENEKPLVEWIPCSVRLPRYNEYVLAYRPEMAIQIIVDCYDEGWTYSKDDAVVAWMPLPEPYKEEGDRND